VVAIRFYSLVRGSRSFNSKHPKEEREGQSPSGVIAACVLRLADARDDAAAGAVSAQMVSRFEIDRFVETEAAT